VWTSDFTAFYRRVISSPDFVAFILTAAGCCVLTFIALLWRRRCAGIAGSVIAMPQLVDVYVVLACIACPTVALESGSPVWTPGTRWPMIYQLTIPALFVTLIALILMTVTIAGALRYRLWSAAVSIAVGMGALFSLAHNQLQVEITQNEKFVRDSLLRLISEDLALGRRPPLQVLLKLDPVSRSRWRSSDTLSPVIARVWLKREDISFRLIPWFPTPSSAWASWWPIRFGPDSEGVGNAKLWNGGIPYDDVRILEVKARTARRVSIADRRDFDGWEVQWQRDKPITVPGIDATQFCPLIWSAAQDALLSGWSVDERDEKGPMRWTTSRSARLTLPSACRNRSILRVIVAYAVSRRNIEDLALYVDGQKLRYHRTFSDGDFVYEAELPSAALSARPVLDIELVVGSLDILPGAAHRFGVAVRRMEIVPVGTASNAPTPAAAEAPPGP
jgi:hypothetical protein